jgi:hypothetical protein
MSEYEKQLLKTYNLSNEELQAVINLFKSLVEIVLDCNNN